MYLMALLAAALHALGLGQQQCWALWEQGLTLPVTAAETRAPMVRSSAQELRSMDRILRNRILEALATLHPVVEATTLRLTCNICRCAMIVRAHAGTIIFE